MKDESLPELPVKILPSGRVRLLARKKINLSLHPNTVKALADLGQELGHSHSVLAERLILCLRRAVTERKYYCICGDACPFQRAGWPDRW